MDKWTDTEAMNRIHALMDGQEWSLDTLQDIAEVVQLTGRVIREPHEMDEEEVEE